MRVHPENGNGAEENGNTKPDNQSLFTTPTKSPTLIIADRSKASPSNSIRSFDTASSRVTPVKSPAPVLIKSKVETTAVREAERKINDIQDKLASLGSKVVSQVTNEMITDLEKAKREAEKNSVNQEAKRKKMRQDVKKILDTIERQKIRRGEGCGGPLGLKPGSHSLREMMGKLRKWCLLSCENPLFDQFIMVCIIINCVFLALADPTTNSEPRYQQVASLIFLLIFTLECFVKLIALLKMYFDDYWNWLDIVVVVEGWISLLSSGSGYLAGLKTLRILRPLRVANRMPALKKIISAMLSSLPAIMDTFIVFFLFLLLSAMVCVMIWSGTFHYRCQDDVTLEFVDTDTLCYPPVTANPGTLCRALQFLDNPYTCESGESCVPWSATPEDGSINFDNIGYSMLTLFSVCTMEGWAAVLYYAQAVTGESAFFIFLAIIVVGNFTIVNLMIAAILVQIDTLASDEKSKISAVFAPPPEKLSPSPSKDGKRYSIGGGGGGRSSLVLSVNRQGNEDGKDEDLAFEEVEVKPSFPSLLHRISYEVFRVVDQPLCKLYCYDGVPRHALTWKNWARRSRWLVTHDASPFSYFIQGCILCNLVILAMDGHNIHHDTRVFLRTANYTLTGIFTFEMVVKLVIGGLPDYVHSSWNLFDGCIVTGSLLELILASGASSLSALRVVRMLRLTRVARLARLANKWKSLQDVLKLIKKSSSGVGPVLLLLILFMFIFSILGMQLFGKTVKSDDFVRFDSFTVAFVQCFYVITGEAWDVIMYVAMRDTGVFSFLYFVSLIIIGCFILVNLVLAVILGDSMVPNTVGYEAGLAQLEATVDAYNVRCSLARWKWFTAEARHHAERRKALHAWHTSYEVHGMERFGTIAVSLGMSPVLLDSIHDHLRKIGLSSHLGQDSSNGSKLSPSPPAPNNRLLIDTSSKFVDKSNGFKGGGGSSSSLSSSGASTPQREGSPVKKSYAHHLPSFTKPFSPLHHHSSSIHPEKLNSQEDFDEKTWDKIFQTCGIVDRFAKQQLPGQWSEEIDHSTKTLKYKDVESGDVHTPDKHPEHSNYRAEVMQLLHVKKVSLFQTASKISKVLNIDQGIMAKSASIREQQQSSMTRSERKRTLAKSIINVKFMITSVEAFDVLEEIAQTSWELKIIRFRKFCVKVVSSKEWNILIMAAIIISSVIMVLQDENTTFLGAYFMIDVLCNIVFFLEVILMCGALESFRSHGQNVTGIRAYLEDNWNRVDLAIVLATILAPIFTVNHVHTGYWVCTVIRSFRPLKAINRVSSLKSTVHLLYMSMMRLGTLGLFITFALIAYSVVGMQLLKGLYYYCEDGDYADDEVYLNTVGVFPKNSPKDGVIDSETGYYTHRPCEGVYTNMNGTVLVAHGNWRNPTFHFDDFFNSFLSVFVMSTEGWAEIVWNGLAATEIDSSPAPYHNTNILILWYFFFGVAFFALYMINLFIGVVFDLYIEMKHLEDDGKLKKREERSWAEYLQRLQAVKPIIAKVPPQHPFRKKVEILVRSTWFYNFIIGVIILNALTLIVIHRGQGDEFTDLLEWTNVVLALIFVLESILKIIGHGVPIYFSNSVDLFDFTVSVVSMVDSMLFLTSTCTDNDSAFLRFVRSMRVFRLLRLVNLFRGCEDILLACRFALPRLLMVCSLLLILIFFFANIGWVIFQEFHNHGSTYANFRTVFGGMQLLFVIMTGDAWTDTFGELVDDKPHLKLLVVAYFFCYLIVQYFVVVNLFVMVVCEAFEILSEGNRTAIERVLPVFQDIWSRYDPNATGTIHEKHIETLLRQIPEPIGISFNSSYTHVRARGDFLRLHRVGDEISFTDVLCGLVAIWLTEEGQTIDSEVAVQMNRLSASIIINSASRRWIQNRQIRLNKRKLAEEMEREKMRREDTRLTDIMKKATMKVAKIEPLLFKNLQRAQQAQQKYPPLTVSSLGVGANRLTPIMSADEASSSVKSMSSKFSEKEGGLVGTSSSVSKQGWGIKSSSDSMSSPPMSPQVKATLETIENYIGDRYEEL